jgi:HPt (histidine-containing phosphotransfer) domain-containing protein
MTAEAGIDRTVLDSLLQSLGGDQEFFAELLETFFEDSPQQIAAMQAALPAGNAEELRRAAHTLKSNSASFGAMALSARCKALEMMGKAGSLEGAGTEIALVAADYDRARAALETIQEGG